MAAAAQAVTDGPDFMDIPDLVRDKILSFLDYDTRISSRLVCSQWRDSIDNCGQGFTVTVDDRDPSNTELTNSVLIREAHVLSLRQPSEEFFYKPRLLNAAKFHGQLPIPWFVTNVLQGCQFLNKVVLRGDFICGQELTFGLTPAIPTQVTCPNLKNLEIIFNEPENFPYAPQGNPEPLPGQEVKFPEMANILTNRNSNRIGMLENGIYAVDVNHLDEDYVNLVLQIVNTVDRNMSFLLGLFRSPCLELLHIHDVIFPLYGSYRYWPFFWKSRPFREFLQFHSKTLRYVYLPSYLGNQDSMASRWETFPKDLIEFDLLLHFRDLEQNNTVWESMLAQQNNLQELTLNLFRFPFPFYQTLFWLLPHTLRKLVVRLQLRPEDYQSQLEINGVAFNRWHQLEYLHIQNVHGKWGWNKLGFTNNSMVFTNFGLLPATLKTIIIRRMNIAGFRADSLAKFRKLRHIQMGSIVPTVDPGNTAKLFRQILRMRKLNAAEIYFRGGIGFKRLGCRKIFQTYANVPEEPSSSGFLGFLTDIFCPTTHRKTVSQYKDATGMAVLNFYPANMESHLNDIMGFRLVPKFMSNQNIFLELFEAPRNREITFKIFDSGNLYLAQYQEVYPAEVSKQKLDIGLELIVKKDRAGQQKLQRYLDQDTIILGCCANPIFEEDLLPEAEST